MAGGFLPWQQEEKPTPARPLHPLAVGQRTSSEAISRPTDRGHWQVWEPARPCMTYTDSRQKGLNLNSFVRSTRHNHPKSCPPKRLDQWLLVNQCSASQASHKTVQVLFFYTFINLSSFKTVPPATAPLPLNTCRQRQVSAPVSSLPGGKHGGM